LFSADLKNIDTWKAEKQPGLASNQLVQDANKLADHRWMSPNNQETKEVEWRDSQKIYTNNAD
jgi:hypothetical protein